MRAGALLLLPLLGCAPTERAPHDLPESWRAGLLAEARPTSSSATPPRFEAGEVVESLASSQGRFRIHFTRSGPNAVPSADTDGNGVPDMVDLVASTYERVAAFYEGLGFLPPPDDGWLEGDHGGDARFDVYLVDFAGRADGAFRADGCIDGNQRCSGYMLQENDFAGYGYPSLEHAVDTLASHEFFHAVQAAYRPDLGSVAMEGTAVWATERFEPELEDLEHFTASFMSRPDRSLVQDPDGPAASFSYGAGLFFQFLGERFGDGALRGLWEQSVQSPWDRWPALLDTVLRRDAAVDFDTAFAEFAGWNLATGPRAWPGHTYARGQGYARITPAPRTLPVDESSVRVTAASTRYFEVPGGGTTVLATYEPEEGTAPDALHLWVAAVTDGQVLRAARADAPAGLSAEVTATDATKVVVAVVDGRMEGTGRYGRLCITRDPTGQPCRKAREEPDAGTPDAGDPNPPDAGAPDAGAPTDAGTPDAGPGQDPAPRGDDDGGGCEATSGGLAAGLCLLLLLAMTPRRSQAARPLRQPARRYSGMKKGARLPPR